MILFSILLYYNFFDTYTAFVMQFFSRSIVKIACFCVPTPINHVINGLDACFCFYFLDPHVFLLSPAAQNGGEPCIYWLRVTFYMYHRHMAEVLEVVLPCDLFPFFSGVNLFKLCLCDFTEQLPCFSAVVYCLLPRSMMLNA